jgi:NAD(P)-dependent dehydrogenase (short-subunit alcohol dehydrogenase family)
MPSVLITGANRGLGLELVRQYTALGWRVLACCRDPEAATDLRAVVRGADGTAEIHRLEITDHAGIEALADRLRNESIDVLFNNAGIYGPKKMYFGQIDYAAWAQVMAVNTFAPLKMAECFIEHLCRGERRVIACMSSAMGSITSNTTGRSYLYRSSKAALNAVVKSVSIDLRARGVVAVALHPGWVRTDMGGEEADLDPADSARGIVAVINGLTPDHSGRFLNYDGSEIPW